MLDYCFSSPRRLTRLQDDEELEWLVTARQGDGVKRSERRRESAETAYHRLLFEESMLQVVVCYSTGPTRHDGTSMFPLLADFSTKRQAGRGMPLPFTTG